MSSQEAITQFVTLFVVIDPAATIALFLVTVRPYEVSPGSKQGWSR
jgi:small neutral amino acid transporter SnatA (MarC family)